MPDADDGDGVAFEAVAEDVAPAAKERCSSRGRPACMGAAGAGVIAEPVGAGADQADGLGGGGVGVGQEVEEALAAGSRFVDEPGADGRGHAALYR
jgi:hypothetical protein